MHPHLGLLSIPKEEKVAYLAVCSCSFFAPDFPPTPVLDGSHFQLAFHFIPSHHPPSSCPSGPPGPSCLRRKGLSAPACGRSLAILVPPVAQPWATQSVCLRISPPSRPPFGVCRTKISLFRKQHVRNEKDFADSRKSRLCRQEWRGSGQPCRVFL